MLTLQISAIAVFLFAAGAPVAAPDSSRNVSASPAPVDTVAGDSLPPIEKMPELNRFVKAEYPPDLVKQGVEGTVLLDIVVNDSGGVDSVYVTKGVHSALDSAAVKAASVFTFTPAMAGGKPVAVILEYAYRFTIDEVVTKIDRYVNLKGRLFERGTRSPITNATVAVSFPDTAADTGLTVPFTAYLKKIGSFDGQSLQSGMIITTTDSLGSFTFQSLPACPAVVKIVASDFETLVDRLLLSRAKALDVVYRLQRVSYGDNELVVYGKAERKEVAQQTLTLNEVRKIPGLGGDAVKVIQALPGVARASLLSGEIIVRGSSTGDSHFYVDGITIPILFHFGGITSTYNSEALASVDLYPGGFGTRYGNALGGVVEIKGRQPKTDRFHGYIDGNLFDASFLVEGPISPKLSFLATARRSYIADVLSFALDKLGVSLPFTMAPYYWDYVSRVDYAASKDQHLHVTLFGAQDRMDMTFNEVRSGSRQIDDQTNKFESNTFFHMGIVGWDWRISPKIKNEMTYALCDLHEGFKAFGWFKWKGTSLAHYIRDELSFEPSNTLTCTAGLDIQVAPYDLDMTATDASKKIVRDKESFNFGPYGAYVNFTWKPSPRFTLVPGLRYDYYPELIYDGSIVPEFWDYRFFKNNRGISGEPSLRVSGRFEITPGHTAKMAVGTYNVTPQPIGQTIDKQWGDPTLPAGKGSQYVAGYEWKISPLISADIQTYFNMHWDYARSPGGTELAADPSLPPFLSNDKARMSGLEIMLKHDQGTRFFGWVAYSLSRSLRWDYAQKRWAVYDHDQTNNLQLIGSYKLTPSQELGVRLRYVTGDPTTPIYGPDYYDATLRRYVPRTGAFNSGRVDPYVSFDMRYEKTVTYKMWLLHFYIDVTHIENLFGKGYESPEMGQYRWNYDYTQKTVIADVTRPALGMRVDF
jgi:TonB family protein